MKTPFVSICLLIALFITGAFVRPLNAQTAQNACTIPVPAVTTYPTPGASPLTDNNYTYPAEFHQAAQNCKRNINVYMAAQNVTGVPWYLLAGLHHIEGGCNPNQSLVSGRIIGTVEPDVHGNCSSQNNGIGLPVPMAGGCGFRNLLDTAIYAGNHLKGKIGKVPVSIQEMAAATSRYNGGGNSNCGRVNAQMPYCPRLYEGYDDIYPFSKYDTIHQKMYLVYCADYTKCNPPKEFTRFGVLTIANILSK